MIFIAVCNFIDKKRRVKLAKISKYHDEKGYVALLILIVFLESKFCHITPFLKTLLCLPFRYRIVFKVSLITFKGIHGLAPSFISNLISVKDINGRYSLRSSNGILLVIDSFVWLPLNYGTLSSPFC